MAGNVSVLPRLHPAPDHVDVDPLAPQPTRLLGLVAGDEPARRADHPPPCVPPAGPGQDRPHGAGRPGPARLEGHLAVGHDITRLEREQHAVDGLLPRGHGRLPCPTVPGALTASDVASHVATIADQGYTIVEDAIEPALVDELTSELHRLEVDLGIVPAANEFEGTQTV